MSFTGLVDLLDDKNGRFFKNATGVFLEERGELLGEFFGEVQGELRGEARGEAEVEFLGETLGDSCGELEASLGIDKSLRWNRGELEEGEKFTKGLMGGRPGFEAP